ncbi:MAG: PAS domain S-box protein [Bacteroidia bacterium]|nr:PAS domain S-box protein [Bacteroidia bacterium]
MESTLPSLEARAQASFDNHPDGIVWVDLTGKIVFVNETAAFLYDCPKEQLLGTTIYSLTPDANYEVWKQRWLQVLDIRELHLPCQLVTTKGKVAMVDTVARVVQWEGASYIAYYLRETSPLDEARMLKAISEGTAAVVGGDFFKSLAYHLVNSMRIRYAIITECRQRGQDATAHACIYRT